MDRWDAVQVKKMELGGNEQLRSWFAHCQTGNSALEVKYRTKAATLYRCVGVTNEEQGNIYCGNFIILIQPS